MTDLNSPPNDAPPRRSRARERQERRRGRQSAPSIMASPGPGSARKSMRRLTPAGGFTWPEIKMPPYVRTLLMGALGLAFMATIILMVGMLKNDPAPVAPNAIWIGEDWTHQPRTEDEIRDFARRLRQNQIGTVYAWVSWLDDGNQWAGGPDEAGTFALVESQVQQFVTTFKRVYPEAVLYAWIRVPAVRADGTYRLDESALQTSVAGFSTQLTNRLRFDGVFLEVGAMPNEDPNYLALLQRVRGVLGSSTRLAASLPPDWTPLDVDIPKPLVIVEGTEWGQQYKQRVALLVDQMVVRAYDSYLSWPDFTASDYATWAAYQVETYAQAVADLQSSTSLIIGIASYENELPAHDVRLENIISGIDGVLRGLQQSSAASSVVTGVGIYAEWAMSDDQWDEFRVRWVQRR